MQAVTRSAKAEERQRKMADREAAKSIALAQFLKTMIEAAGPSIALGRDTSLLKETLADAAKRIETELGDHPEVEADLRVILGNTYHDLGMYSESEVMHRKAFAIRQSIFPKSDPRYIESMYYLGEALCWQTKLKEAEPFVKHGLQLARQQYGQDNPLVAKFLRNVSWVQAGLGDSAAEQTIRQSLELQEKLRVDDFDISITKSHLAGILANQERFTDAESLLREVVATRRTLLGDAHPKVAESLKMLAFMLRYQNKLHEAEQKYREALDICQQVLGENHPDAIHAMSELATFLLDHGDVTGSDGMEAEALAEKAYRASRNSTEQSFILTGQGIVYARVLERRGKLDDAEEVARVGLSEVEEFHGTDSVIIMNHLDYLSKLLGRRHKYEEAVLFAERFLRLQEAHYGETTPAALSKMEYLQQLYGRLGRQSDQERLLRRKISIRRNNGDADPPIDQPLSIARDIHTLAHFLSSMPPRFDEAEALYCEANALLEQYAKPHFSIANQWAWLLSRMGRPQEGEQVLRDYLNAVDGWDDVGYQGRIQQSLAAMREQQGDVDEAERIFRRQLDLAKRQSPEKLAWHNNAVRPGWQLAAFLMRQERVAQAINVLDQCWPIATQASPYDNYRYHGADLARQVLRLQLLGRSDAFHRMCGNLLDCAHAARTSSGTVEGLSSTDRKVALVVMLAGDLPAPIEQQAASLLSWMNEDTALDEAWNNLLRGLQKARKGEIDQAEALLQRALGSPDVVRCAVAHAFLARIEHQRGNIESAKDLLWKGESCLGLRAIIQSDNSVDPYTVDFLEEDSAWLALEDARDMIATGETQQTLGGIVERAIRLQQALALRDSDPTKFYHLAMLQAWFGRTDELQSLCHTQLEGTDQTAAQNDFGARAVLLGRVSSRPLIYSAIAASIRAVDQLSEHDDKAGAYLGRGVAELHRGKVQDAEQWLTRCVNDGRPALRGTALIYRAIARHRQADRENASDDFEAGKTIMPRMPADRSSITAEMLSADNIAHWLAVLQADAEFSETDLRANEATVPSD